MITLYSPRSSQAFREWMPGVLILAGMVLFVAPTWPEVPLPGYGVHGLFASLEPQTVAAPVLVKVDAAPGGDRPAAARAPAVSSFQIRHPALVGFISGLSFGLWPRNFGADVHPLDAYQDGWTREQATLLLPYAEEAFRFWRTVGTFVLAAVFVSVFLIGLRKSTRPPRRRM